MPPCQDDERELSFDELAVGLSPTERRRGFYLTHGAQQDHRSRFQTARRQRYL